VRRFPNPPPGPLRIATGADRATVTSVDSERATERVIAPEVPLSPVLTRTHRLTRTSTSSTVFVGRRQRELERKKAAEKKEFGAAHVDDTTRDRVPNESQNPVGYIEDTQTRTEDKCR
jgi:hypothetical protein